MQTVETSSFREATRYRRAQYSGRATELRFRRVKIFRHRSRSVQEDRSRSPHRWIVTIAPTVEKPTRMARPSHQHALVRELVRRCGEWVRLGHAQASALLWMMINWVIRSSRRLK